MEYLLFIPVLFAVFSHFRERLGPPKPLDEHLGRFFGGQCLLPFQRHELREEGFRIGRILVPLDGSASAEHAIPVAELLARTCGGDLDPVSVLPQRAAGADGSAAEPDTTIEAYLDRHPGHSGKVGSP